MSTSLSNKHAEPLIIRKYQHPYGFPVFVALICGSDLTEIDRTHDVYAEVYWGQAQKIGTPQALRNYFGNMSGWFVKVFSGPGEIGTVEDAWTDSEELDAFRQSIQGRMATKQKKVEACAVVAFADKGVISSLWGDFMTHEQCRLELFQLLNMTTQV